MLTVPQPAVGSRFLLPPSLLGFCLAGACVGLECAVTIMGMYLCICPVVSRKHGFPEVTHYLWFIQSFCPLFLKDPGALRWDVNVWFQKEKHGFFFSSCFLNLRNVPENVIQNHLNFKTIMYWKLIICQYAKKLGKDQCTLPLVFPDLWGISGCGGNNCMPCT